MDPEIVDSVTADSLEVGDLILSDTGYSTVTSVEDNTDVIIVEDDEDNVYAFNPDARIDLYMYPGVTVE